MIILRNKNYSRFSEAMTAGTIGSMFGALPGAAIGSLIGGKRGALVGMLLGAATTGILAARAEYKSNNPNIVKINGAGDSKIREFKENPGQSLREFFGEEENLIQQYKALEDEDFKVPDEFIKLLKIRKQFIPTLERWIKENPENVGDWMSVMYIPLRPQAAKKELQEMLKFRGVDYEDDELCYTLMMDPEQSDDKLILYYPFIEKFGIDSTEGGGAGTLKQTILWNLRNEIEYLTGYGRKFDPSGSLIQLYKEYEKFIKQRL